MTPTSSPRTRLRIMLTVGLTALLASTISAAPTTAATVADDAPEAHQAVADSGTPPAATLPPTPDGTESGGISAFAGDDTFVPDDSADTAVPEDNVVPGIQSVIGTDNRTRVNPTTGFPSRAIVQIVRTTGGKTWGCTGWLYGASIVATAGHCVHPGGGGNFYARGDFAIIPGRNGTTRPYGTCRATQLLSVNGWTRDGNETYDYGAIRLNCSVGNTTGWFGLWWQSASLTGTATTVSGYPCDKTFGQQWRHGGQTVKVTHTRQVFYQNDTAGCQSGSPVYQSRASGSKHCSGQCVMAIHAYGTHGSSPHSGNNHGTRITEGVYKNLINWRNG